MHERRKFRRRFPSEQAADQSAGPDRSSSADAQRAAPEDQTRRDPRNPSAEDRDRARLEQDIARRDAEDRQAQIKAQREAQIQARRRQMEADAQREAEVAAAQEAAEDERLRQEDAARRAAEEDRRNQDLAARQAAEEERLKQQEAARRAAEEEYLRQQEAARKAAEEERLRQQEAARKAADEEQIRQQEAQRRAAEEERLKQQEAAREAAEEERRDQEKSTDRSDTDAFLDLLGVTRTTDPSGGTRTRFTRARDDVNHSGTPGSGGDEDLHSAMTSDPYATWNDLPEDEAPLTLSDAMDVSKQASETSAPRAYHGDASDIQTSWAQLLSVPLDEDHLTQNNVVTAQRNDPAYTQFDVLRTRLLQALADNGWRRVAITSPSQRCGKTFTAANLAVSLSRQENCRGLVLDFDMRRPALHKALGVSQPGAIADMLRGEIHPDEHLLRLGHNTFNAGPNIAFGMNGVIEPYASELLQDPRCADTLNHLEELYDPHIMLFDLPPALYYDDVIAFRPHFDGVLLVLGGGVTTEKEVREVEKRLGTQTPLLGMILNMAEGTEIKRYSY